MRSRRLIAAAGLAMVVAACAKQGAPKSESTSPPPAAPAAQPAEHTLHNVLTVTDKLLSGSVPDSDAAFDELKAMGIKTIISVDGAEPDVEKARSYGMRYVHIPVGYHGIDGDHQLILAKAVDEVEGPIYLHCHHGRHRGPAAAASAAVVLGEMSADEGVAFLKKAGTAPTYPGLYECVQGAEEAEQATLNSMPSDFPEIAPTPGYVKAMAESQERYDHLAEIKDAGWRVPPEHPDLVPLAEAARLENLMRALIDDEEVAKHPPDFAQLMRDSARRCQEFEDALAAKAPAADLTARLKAVNGSCKSCHVKYRDVK
jgi:protein tyrosine phosphatase (PTP) superfamily phosphohydrolase (DUF442 family)